MANGDGNGNGWRGWALGILATGCASMLGLGYNTLERRTTRNEDSNSTLLEKSARIEGKVDHLGRGQERMDEKLDALLWTKGIDPRKVDAAVEREQSGG